MDRNALIADLRMRIAGKEAAPSPLISLGGAGEVLPGGGLKSGGLHEVAAAAYRDMGAATGFAAALVSCVMKQSALPVLWCETARPPFDMGRLYGPGIGAFGIDPARFLFVEPPSDTDCLWVMEEALRARAFAAVIGEVDGRSSALDLSTTRRLQLTAEETQTPVLLFTGHGRQGASVAVTRWQVASAESESSFDVRGGEKLPGRARWSVSLTRCRGGKPGRWLMEWDGEAADFSFVTPMQESESISLPAPQPSEAPFPFRRTG